MIINSPAMTNMLYTNLCCNELSYKEVQVSGVGSSPTLVTCETSQVLLAGVQGGFSRGSPIFSPPTDWPVSYELK